MGETFKKKLTEGSFNPISVKLSQTNQVHCKRKMLQKIIMIIIIIIIIVAGL